MNCKIEQNLRCRGLGGVPVRDGPRRPGDVAGGFSNVDKARTVLKWSTQHSLEDGVRSALEWAARRQEILGYE